MSKPAQGGPEDIAPVKLLDALRERYLAYALSTITSRSLPDVRDGLKPVQRRILYAMLQLRLDPASGFKKCARVVGDVIGKYHPHGDVAVYDALVRLAQDFAQRYPLVDGQGNFGNIDGDNAAAMRYTESRLTDVATALLDGIDADTVDFRGNYDGSEHEPVILPADFPNLLANGASGIAVGMATSIPPHNAGELCRALVHMLERPADAGPAAVDDVLRFISGPDLPTGGVLVEPASSIREAYATGRGGFRLRARWEVEKLDHGQYQVVVTEIPYQVQKSRLIERIAELLSLKKLTLLADVRDESTEFVRLVLVPRSRTVPAVLLMEQMFRQTELEGRLSLNLNVIDAQGVPRVMSLVEALEAFLAHRMDVLVRGSKHRLAKIEDRIEILEGYIKAFLNLDEVIRIIRDEDEPRPVLMQRFELTERQAEAILNLRLRNLRRLEEKALDKERRELGKERKKLLELLGDEGLRRTALAAQIRVTEQRFGSGALGDRRTLVGEMPEVDAEAYEEPVERNPTTVVCSKNGWLRGVRGHLESTADLRYKEGDEERFVLRCLSSDSLLVLMSDGRCFLLAVDKLPGARSLGEPLGVFVDVGKGSSILDLRVHDPKGRLVFATRQGRGFVAEEVAVAAQTRAGRQVVNLDDGDAIAIVEPVRGDHVATIGTNRKLLIFPLTELPVMARGKGVTLQRYKDGDLSDLRTLNLAEGLTWPQGERTRRETDLAPWLGKRGASGRIAPNGFPRTNRFG